MLTLTTISIAIAAGCAAMVWRQLNAERARSAARVQALGAAIDSAVSTATRPVGRMAAVPPDASPAPAIAVASLFEPSESTVSAGRPLLKVAVIGTMALALIVTVAMQKWTPTEGGQTVTVQAEAPLELLSMRQARDGSALTVSGLVKNPAGGAPIAGLTAVVFAFDQKGTFITSGQAKVDFVSLEPGRESPFVVTIPDAAQISRYRVSFRTAAGVVRHLDLRGERVRLASTVR